MSPQSPNAPAVSDRHEVLKSSCNVASEYKYRTDSHLTKSGKPCIRWDLLPQDLASIDWDSYRSRSHILASDWIGGNNTLSYAENFCSFVLNKDTLTGSFGCYSNRSLSSFEECDKVTCQSSVLAPEGRFSRSSLVFIIILIIVLIILTLGFLFVWVIPQYKHRKYRPIKRYISPKVPSLGYIRNGELLSAANLPFDFGPAVRGPDNDDPAQTEPRFNYVDQNVEEENKTGLSLGALNFSSHMGALGFPNPIYTPLNDDFIDDFEIDTTNKQQLSADI